MRFFNSVPVLLFIAGAALAHAPVWAGQKSVPDMSGIWKIDEELSDDPLEKALEIQTLRAASAGGSGASVIQGGGSYGGPAHGGPQGGVPQVPQAGTPQAGAPGGSTTGSGGAGGSVSTQGGPDLSPELEERFAAMEESRWQVEITQSDSDVTLRYGDGEAITLPISGKAIWVETTHGGFDVSARWKKNGRLFIKSKAKHGSSTETYEVAGGGKLLTVTTEMDMGRLGWVTYRWLYRPRAVVDKAALKRN